jgi:hypothetical protein
MKKAFIILVLLLGAWTYVPVRERTYVPIFQRLGPWGMKLVQPSQEGAARTKAQHLLRMLIVDLRQGRALPDPQNFDHWVRSRTDEADPTLDPWGSLYYYERRDNRIVVGSPGPDRRRGTADDIIVIGGP